MNFSDSTDWRGLLKRKLVQNEMDGMPSHYHAVF